MQLPRFEHRYSAIMLALPASAGTFIEYRGETSQGQFVSITVLKRDSGRRFLYRGGIDFTVTCEDASTHDFGLGFRGKRLGDGGAFHVERQASPGELGTFSYIVDGAVASRSGEGTFEFWYGSLNADDQPQLCATETVDWSLSRAFSHPATPRAVPLRPRVTINDGMR